MRNDIALYMSVNLIFIRHIFQKRGVKRKNLLFVLKERGGL